METILRNSLLISVLVSISAMSIFAQELKSPDIVFQTQQIKSGTTNYEPIFNPIELIPIKDLE